MKVGINSMIILINLILSFTIGYIVMKMTHHFPLAWLVVIPFFMGFLPPFMIRCFETITWKRCRDLALQSLILAAPVLLIFFLFHVIYAICIGAVLVAITLIGGKIGYECAQLNERFMNNTNIKN